MENEDDICILSPSESPEREVNFAPLPNILLSPLPASSPSPLDYDSHYALQKAYTEIKQRLKDSTNRNQQLTQKIQELEARTGFSCDARFGQTIMEETSNGSQEAADLQMAAEEGFTNNLQRQLAITRNRLMAAEVRNKKAETEIRNLKEQLQKAQDQVQLLIAEKKTHIENNKTDKTVQDLGEKCQELEQEKQAIIREADQLRSALYQAQKEVVRLKENYGYSLSQEVPADLAMEVAAMRNIISRLKEMVAVQKEHLDSRKEMLSMTSSSSGMYPMRSSGHSLRDVSSVEPDISPLGSRQSAGSHVGPSWEMVNTSSPLLSSWYHQQQEQQQQLKAMQQRTVTCSSEYQNTGTITNAMTGQRIVNGSSDVKTFPRAFGSQSAVIQRNKSVSDDCQPKSKTEVIRSRTHNQPVHQGYWPHNSGLQQQEHMAGSFKASGARLTQYHDLKEPRVVQGMATHPKIPVSAMLPPGRMYSPDSQPSPLTDSSNPNHSEVLPTNSNTAPSMHILNRSGMVGARVIRNTSDSFGSSGGTIVTAPSELPGILDTTSTETEGHRALPQEHVDSVLFNNISTPELYPVQFDPELRGGQGVSGSDRRCPVCAQDFSHVSMDEFQTHVFECFDRSEESASGLETLHAHQMNKDQAQPVQRVCPMCEKKFAENTNQQYFEGHVQSHFVDAAEQFEVLDVQVP